MTDIETLVCRLRTMLPDNYRDSYEELLPEPMKSAGLVYRDGRVAWDEIWGSFCDLAMAGGPSHRGSLLQPGSEEEVHAAPARHAQVVEEICRGLHLVTGLYAEASPVAGWVQLYCPAAAMTDWLARAITMENVSAHRQDLVLSLPAGPDFRLEKEVKNVITAVAKTTHYWEDHTAEDRKTVIAELFRTMNAEYRLLQPALRPRAIRATTDDEARLDLLARAVGDVTALEVTQAQTSWLGLDCKSVPLATRVMRLLVVCNVLARREGTTVFVPADLWNPLDVEDLASRLQRVFRAVER